MLCMHKTGIIDITNTSIRSENTKLDDSTAPILLWPEMQIEVADYVACGQCFALFILFVFLLCLGFWGLLVIGGCRSEP